MSTSNFENTKNGIFVIESCEPMSDDDTIDMEIDDTIDNIINDLEVKGYEIIQVTLHDYKVVGNSIDGQIGLRIQSGYYADAQVIITTQRDEQFMNANMSEEDITKDLYEFVDEDGFTEYTDDKYRYEDDDEYYLSKVLHYLNEVLHNVLWYDDTYEEVLDDMLPDDKVVIDIVSQYTTPIKKVGNFSNGEALYEKA